MKIDYLKSEGLDEILDSSAGLYCVREFDGFGPLLQLQYVTQHDSNSLLLAFSIAYFFSQFFWQKE